jgi:hypothetical protein
MGIFDGFAEGLAGAIDDIRHQVVEEGYFGRQTTGNIELPQVETPTDNIYDMTPNQQSAPSAPSQSIEPPQIEPPSHDMER